MSPEKQMKDEKSRTNSNSEQSTSGQQTQSQSTGSAKQTSQLVSDIIRPQVDRFQGAVMPMIGNIESFSFEHTM